MNKGQQHEDTVLEEARYLLTGVLRPLDILGYEICSANIADTDAQQFLQMIHDVRSLLLNISYTLNYQTKFLTVNAFFDDPAVSLRKFLEVYTIVDYLILFRYVRSRGLC